MASCTILNLPQLVSVVSHRVHHWVSPWLTSLSQHLHKHLEGWPAGRKLLAPSLPDSLSPATRICATSLPLSLATQFGWATKGGDNSLCQICILELCSPTEHSGIIDSTAAAPNVATAGHARLWSICSVVCMTTKLNCDHL